MTHSVFHAKSHHGRHQAPVVASIRSEPPKSRNVTPARMQSLRMTPLCLNDAINMATPIVDQSPASTWLERTKVGSITDTPVHLMSGACAGGTGFASAAQRKAKCCR